MLRIKIILSMILLPAIINAQVIFKTIGPQQAVVVGDSFPIQYVLEDIDKNGEFTPPSFEGFEMVSGPNIYGGTLDNGDKEPTRLKNIVFTLVAIKTGRFIIAGATAKVNGKFIKSDRAVINVITKADAFQIQGKLEKEKSASEYFLHPGEDPTEKIKKNLFMKVTVDRKSCYVGQPVVATFKLYSRLESKSDIVKNPGFYGFTVQDIINLNDNITATEIINGKPFDVHTIRAVQLYPLQAGEFTIDAMEIMNKVKFSKSIVNKKTEQEITEGVFENNDPPANDNTVSYESSLSTEKIDIYVKPYPVIKKPLSFTGATGNFSIHASLEKDHLSKSVKGSLIVTIRGKGNFTQLSPPVIQWPSGIEVFDPVIKDSLDKTQAPLKGTRTFHFPFVADKAGSYSIPSVSFTFFNPDSNNYKTVSAGAIEIKVSNEAQKETAKQQEPAVIEEKTDNTTLWIYGVVFFIVLLIMVLQLRKPKKEQLLQQTMAETTEPVVSVEHLLQPAQFSIVADDKDFYNLLQNIIWNHLSPRLNLSGSRVNKYELYKAMKGKQLDEQLCLDILSILDQCEAAVFTKAEFLAGKQELLNRTKAILEQIKL